MPAYTCLSYCWGEDTTTFPLTINGAVIRIRRTLMTFLRQAQDAGSGVGWLWIDALCIDQTSTSDRNRFVPMMNDIYWNAEKVLVSLGAGNRDIEQAFAGYGASVDKYSLRGRDHLTLDDMGRAHGHQGIFAGLKLIYAHPYWNRAWILQEATIPDRTSNNRPLASCEVWYGKQRLPLRDLLIGRDMVSAQSIRHVSNIRLQLLGHPIYHLQSIQHLRHLALEKKVEEVTIFNVLHQARTRQATMPHDRLYALRGLASDIADFAVNYAESAEEVYRDFAIYCIQKTSSLAILGYARTPNCGNFLSLPSWVPDWTDVSVPEPLPKQTRTKIFSDEASMAASTAHTQTPGGRTANDLSFQALLSGPTPVRFEVDPVYHASGDMKPHFTFSADGSQLHVVSFEFDRVARLLDSIITTTQPPRRELVPNDSDVRGPYMTGGTYLDALRHTMCADVEVGPRVARRGHTVHWPEDGDLMGSMTQSALEQMMRFGAEIGTARISSKGFDVPGKLLEWLSNRRLFVTERGFVGMGPEGMMPGDTVQIVAGSQVPLIIRTESTQNKFVGEAYVHGIMDGEVVAGQHAAFLPLICS